MKTKQARKRQWRRRRLILLFSTLLSLLVLIGGTYAWVTLADTRTNRLSMGRLEVVLEGNQRNDILTPAYQSEKQIRVRNNGTGDALVRVSLSEVLLTFEMDVSDKNGNGHLKEQNKETPTVINEQDATTWQPGRTLQTPQGTLVIGKERVENARFYWQNAATPRPALFDKSVALQFTDRLTTTTPAPVPLVRQYWLYYEGYFYYSEVLRSGEVTPNLLATIKVSPKAANQVKGSLYQLKGQVQGTSAARSSISDGTGWNLGKTNPVYKLFDERLKPLEER